MSRKQKTKNVTLHEPELAVHNYLESLLKEIDEAPIEPEKVLVQVKSKRATVVKIRPTVKAEVESAVEIQVPADIPVKEEISTAKVDALNGEVGEIVVPAWANEPFQTLFFKVRGMTLGIPLIALDSIVEWSAELTSLPGQQDWNRGVLVHRDQRVVVVDTAQLIAPQHLSRASEKRNSGSHILMVGNGKWGLACDGIQNPRVLDKDGVRWRKGTGLQPWMAGTIIDQLCVLLDVDALVEMIRHK